MWRWAILAGLLLTGIAGATSVYLLGSHNRNADRREVLRYEAAVLAQVREMAVVAGTMADAAEAFSAGRLPAAAFARSAGQWQQTLVAVAVRIEAVTVPAPFGDGETMFGPAAREYARAAGLYASFAACSQNSVGPSASCIETANASPVADYALALYRHAANVMQATRERLGLARSPNFGDPPR
jgi:hypothetical protein